jgi:hypothetical protein
VDHQLNEMKRQRNEWIAAFRKESGTRNHRETAELFFGLRNAEGHVDETYPSLIDAISRYTDDCIWFGQQLCKDLMAHGRRLAREYGKDAPKVTEINFDKAHETGLIPKDEEFAEWMKAFQTPTGEAVT